MGPSSSASRDRWQLRFEGDWVSSLVVSTTYNARCKSTTEGLKLMNDMKRLAKLKRGVQTMLVVAILPAIGAAQTKLTGTVKVDGSSTVAPITTAAAEMFQAEHPRVHVTVGISGTGGGFKKFLAERADLRTDVNGASRPIKDAERELAAKLGVDFIELPVAYDGIAVMVHPENDFCESLTVSELKRIWEPGSAINNWNQIRPEFPDLQLKLYGPGTDSGTFDYFTEVIAGKEKSSRSDYTASESDNVLVMGIAGSKGSLGYFGYSYYAANQGKLKLVAVDNDNGHPVIASLDAIRSGIYEPLARPLFIYVNRKSADRPEVVAFVEFIFKNARTIVEHPKVNYVSLPDSLYDSVWKRYQNRAVGSAIHEAKLRGEIELKSIFED